MIAKHLRLILVAVLVALPTRAERPAPIITWADAQPYNGQDVIVTGTVVASFEVDGNCYLRFSDDQESLVVVIPTPLAGDKRVVPLHVEFTDALIHARGVISIADGTDRPMLTVASMDDIGIGEMTVTASSPPPEPELSGGGPPPSVPVAKTTRIAFDDLNVTVAVSSVQDEWEGEGPPESLVDGDPKTRWSSDYANNQYVTLDFGHVISTTGANLFWEVASAKTYHLLLSSDGENWHTAARKTDGDVGPRTDAVLWPKRDARYLRLALDERATEFGFSLYEVEVLAAD